MSDNDIDKYLFHEMPETDREQFEDKFVSDDSLFYEIAERENDLVDKYANGKLAGDELKRFESSLAMLPARRQKIGNAKVLRELIADERPENKTITIAERTGFFSRLFSFGPALQFASLAAVVLLAVASIFLFTENRRLGSLQEDLAASNQRETDLTARIHEETETSGDLTADLEAERERIAKLEAEIAKLRNTNERPPAHNPPVTIATLFLSSSITRDGSIPVRRLELDKEVTRVSIVIAIPSDGRFTDSVSVTLDGERVAENLRTRVRRGETTISVTVPAAKLKPGRNELTVRDSKNAEAASYIIAIARTN